MWRCKVGNLICYFILHRFFCWKKQIKVLHLGPKLSWHLNVLPQYRLAPFVVYSETLRDVLKSGGTCWLWTVGCSVHHEGRAGTCLAVTCAQVGNKGGG